MKLKERYRKFKDSIGKHLFSYEEYEEDAKPYTPPKIDFTLHIKFFKIQKHQDVDRVREEIKKGNVMAIVDISLFHTKNFAHLRVLTQKLKRSCENLKAELRFYGKNWLIIVPDKIKFHKRKGVTKYYGSKPEPSNLQGEQD